MVTHWQLGDPPTKKTAQMFWRRWKKGKVFIGTGGVLTGFRLIISYVTQLPLHNQCFESPFPQDVAMVLLLCLPDPHFLTPLVYQNIFQNAVFTR